MTPNDARERVDRIGKMRSDAEAAHSEEDNLWRDALQSIAEGSCDDPAELARVALHSANHDFPRWCA